MVGRERRGLGGAASLSRDRNFVKGPNHFLRMVSKTVFWALIAGAFTRRVRIRYLWVPGPACRILEKQPLFMVNVSIPKKLDSSANSFAFQGFYPAAISDLLGAEEGFLTLFSANTSRHFKYKFLMYNGNGARVMSTPTESRR